jgi:hypothetical protein
MSIVAINRVIVPVVNSQTGMKNCAQSSLLKSSVVLTFLISMHNIALSMTAVTVVPSWNCGSTIDFLLSRPIGDSAQ